MTRTGLAETAAVIDLTSKKVMVERLTESKIMCTMEDKVLYVSIMYERRRAAIEILCVK